MEQSANEAIKTTYLSILGNLGLAIAKFVTGFFGNSYALIADAIESTTDVFSSILVLLGLRYASKPADENHPYGHGRAEPLFTFMVVGFLIVSATVIAYESIENIQTPHETPEAYTLIVLAVIIIIKEVFYRIVKKRGKEANSSVLEADAWHHRSDAITSLMAFIGISIALVMGDGYEVADDYAALLASGFILYNAYLILRPALGEIMDEHMHDEMEADIRSVAIIQPGVVETEKCYIRKTGMTYHVDLHIAVDANITVKEGHDIAHRVKDELLKEIPEIADVLIHVEPDDEL